MLFTFNYHLKFIYSCSSIKFLQTPVIILTLTSIDYPFLCIYVHTGLLAKNEFSKHVSALRGLKNLIQSRPADLPELCLELAKILLHLEDNYSLEHEFTQLRHDSLVESVVTCPLQVCMYTLYNVWTWDFVYMYM